MRRDRLHRERAIVDFGGHSMIQDSAARTITLTVNGRKFERTVEDRKLLLDFIREDLGLSGTHAGCEHGVCGACTILFNGQAARSCLLFAVQANGAEVQTVEGLAPEGKLHPLQHSLSKHHGLQCGFCTPGILMMAADLLAQQTPTTPEDIRDQLSGNLCRCTGYKGILDGLEEVILGDGG